MSFVWNYFPSFLFDVLVAFVRDVSGSLVNITYVHKQEWRFAVYSHMWYLLNVLFERCILLARVPFHSCSHSVCLINMSEFYYSYGFHKKMQKPCNFPYSELEIVNCRLRSWKSNFKRSTRKLGRYLLFFWQIENIYWSRVSVC